MSFVTPHALRSQCAGWLLACCAALGLGCFIDTVDSVPAYPGASVGPGYRQQGDSGTSLKQIYYTSDPYYEVVEFYGQYVADQPDWSSEVSEQVSSWSQNMKLNSSMTTAAVLEPSKPGKLIVIVDEGRRTTIRAFSSQPEG